MKSKSLLFLKDVSYYLTNYFPLAFCIAVCQGFKASIGIIFAIFSVLLNPNLKDKKLMPLLISFLILGSNPDSALSATLICGILLIISSFIHDKLKIILSAPVLSGVMLAGALTITVLFTTDYFGIGATGNNVTEMIKSYISLGFHPNWRGVLYGTIVLVLMITFPRKFKNLSKYVSAPFIALIFTLILNLFLNPSDMVSAITEIPYSNITWVKDYILYRTEITFNTESVLIGISLFVIYFYSLSGLENSNRNDYISCGIFNVLSGGFIGLPLPFGANKNIRSIFPRTIAVAIILISFFVFNDIIIRIPVHSCAVVIIVSAWENVRWKEIKNSFSGLLPFIFFVLSVLTCLLTDMIYGILFSSIISFFYILIINNRNKVKNLW